MILFMGLSLTHFEYDQIVGHVMHPKKLSQSN